LVEKEPKEQKQGDQAQPGSEETPPPFQPDYELITVLERGGKEEQHFRREVEDRQSKGNSGNGS
jgi:hypothetical protein